MAYQVIARKWRPQTFDEVTGQELITRTLRGAIEHERLHHAYLFSGARGVGKTTTARLLAKALNCHKSDAPTATPCKTTDADECASCREVAEGRSIDVLEIDAASNTGVDNVRDSIINTVGVRPARDRYKVFIIDEVHMLSGAAFNALLKTLEEPPPRVVFIMATTESHKLPDTILSRCQQFEFRTIPAVKIVERLRLIADAERIQVSDDALREVARAGEGSMRDAQSAFDQVISFSADAIGVEDVETALGLASAELRARVIRAIADETPAGALAVVEDLAMRGHDLRNFCRDLLAHMRDLLVVKVAGESAALTHASDKERQEMSREAEAFSESDLVRFFHSLTETERALREGAHPRYQLEIGLVKLIEMRRLAPVGAILERLAALEDALRTGKPPAANSSSTGAPPASNAPASSSGSGTPPRRSGSGGSRSDSATASSEDFSVAVENNAPSANASGAPSANERDAFAVDKSDASVAGTGDASASNQNQATSTHQNQAASTGHDAPSARRDATTYDAKADADAPPFEPLPPRNAATSTAPAPPTPRIAPIPTLPSSARKDASAPVAPSKSIPSLPKSSQAATPTSPSPPPTSPTPRTLPSTFDATTPAHAHASALKLVPPAPPSQTNGSPRASFFDDDPPPARDDSNAPPAFDDWSATPAARQSASNAASRSNNAATSNNTARSNNVAVPSQTSHSNASSPVNSNASSSAVSASSSAKSGGAAQADSSVELIKKSLDNRRKPFLVIALEGARRVRVEGDELYVEYAPEGKHLRDTLAKPDNVKILREVCREVLGRDMGVAIVVKQAGEGEDDAPRSREDEATLEKQRLREMAEQHPSVQQLLKVFGAEIIEVRRIDTDAQ